jgi:hypothetical protein
MESVGVNRMAVPLATCSCFMAILAARMKQKIVILGIGNKMQHHCNAFGQANTQQKTYNALNLEIRSLCGLFFTGQ